MVQSQFSVSWDSYQKNICRGLSFLQERGEFVDMTLAADGHYVKVHRMVLSLTSPYIKELLCSIDCSHPVLFLNFAVRCKCQVIVWFAIHVDLQPGVKYNIPLVNSTIDKLLDMDNCKCNVTYPTLCSILQYIYTGEVLVDKENLNEFMQAGKALHIKGLDMVQPINNCNETAPDTMEVKDINNRDYSTDQDDVFNDFKTNKKEDGMFETVVVPENADVTTPQGSAQNSPARSVKSPKRGILPTQGSALQYTISNQGGIQVILNRYLYGLRYNNKRGTRCLWRCICYPRKMRCPAYINTEDGVVVERGCSHNHDFHDKLILSKFRDGLIYKAINDAQLQVEIRKKKRNEESVLENS